MATGKPLTAHSSEVRQSQYLVQINVPGQNSCYEMDPCAKNNFV